MQAMNHRLRLELQNFGIPAPPPHPLLLPIAAPLPPAPLPALVAPLKPSKQKAPQSRARRPLKDAKHLQRIRMPSSPRLLMHTVQEIGWGRVHLQVPVDPLTLPQATTVMSGKCFEYMWRYNDVKAKEVISEDGQQWAHIFVGAETSPSVSG